MRKVLVPIIFTLGFSAGKSLFSQENSGCFRVGVHAGGTMFTNFFRTEFTDFSCTELLERDEDGYPLRIPAGATKYECYTSGGDLWEDSIFVLRWDGDGDIKFQTYQGAVVTILLSDKSNRRIEFKTGHTIPHNQGWWHIWLQVTKCNPLNLTPGVDYDPKNPADAAKGHVRNIRIYLKSHESIIDDPDHLFNPYYLEKIKPFYALRFMGAFKINNSKFRTWSDRTTPNYWNQSRGNKGNGLAYEYAVQLCNVAKKHMWFNIPHQADDYSIRKMAELVYNNLDPELDVFLEYSNETWNYAPPFRDQFDYVQARGGNKGHAQLSVNCFRIWREVFGRDSLRVKRVMAGQMANPWHLNQRMSYAGAENVDFMSGTYYFTNANLSAWTSTTTQNEMWDYMFNKLRTSWTDKIKENMALAREWGKPFYCYEGGVGADPEVYACADTFRALQTSPRMLDYYNEAFDTLRACGVWGGNELSLCGTWMPNPNPQKDVTSFWGTLNRLWNNPADYPKYQGYLNNISDCDHLGRVSDTVGAGLAIRLDGANDYINASSTFKPNDVNGNYTIECWMNPERLGVVQTIFSLATDGGTSTNKLFINNANRLQWTVKNNAGGVIADITGPVMALYKWYHVAAVKNGSKYTLYVNGSDKGNVTGNVSGVTSRNRFIFGAEHTGSGNTGNYFCGRIDEIRIWNAAPASLLVLRDWMCKKLTPSHPSWSSLQQYYRFDSVNTQGYVIDQKASFHMQLVNVGFSKYSNYEPSGAPIGDASRQIYPPVWTGVSLSYTHPNGDKFTVGDIANGAAEGLHIYLVNQKPTDDTPPSEAYTKIGSYYYGVFCANGINATYTVIYNYTGNPDASGSETNFRLVKRDGNSDVGNWRNTGAIQDVYADILKTRKNREIYKAEYILGIRPTRISNLPGAGYALRFSRDGTSVADIKGFYRPDGEYTVTVWAKPVESRGTLFQFLGYGASNSTHLSLSHGSDLCFTTDKSWDAVSQCDAYTMDLTGWNHFALVKKDGKVNVFHNGRLLLKDIVVGTNSKGQKYDIDFNEMMVGKNFGGVIDELQIWDKALDSNTIKEWMCRNLTEKHPDAVDHLFAYFKFDEGQGTLIENKLGPGELELIGNVKWVWSGAPVGDTSVYIYSSDKLTLNHPDGDYMSVDIDEVYSVDGGLPTTYGIHLYRINDAPLNSVYPPAVKSIDSAKYWGVFIVSRNKWGNPKKYRYNTIYNYEKNPNVVEESNIRMLTRLNDSVPEWTFHTSVLPNTAAKTITQTWTTPNIGGLQSIPQVLMLGGTTPTAISIDKSVPATPSAITGKNPVCAGETGLVYSVIKDNSRGVFYVWSLPAGMSGYSDSNKIIVNVDPLASGSLGYITVKAVNRYGESAASSLAITAVATGSMSVDISGPVEVCQNESGIVYSIPAVGGVSSYTWEVPQGSIINSGNGTTSISVTFGTQSGNISVYGQFTCGISLINTKPVIVNTVPAADIGVTGGRMCKGLFDEATVTVIASEEGVEYQAYRNGGVVPIGSPVFGTGNNILIALPMNELMTGENIITVKAKKGKCQQVTLTQQAIVTIDVMPDPDMEMYVKEDTLCQGDTGYIVVPGAAAGMRFVPTVTYYWTVDAKPPYILDPGTTSKGGYTEVALKPAPYNVQMSGEGLGMGKNTITMEVFNGVCPSVKMNKTFTIEVPNNPRSINFNQISWWMEKWPEPKPSLSESIYPIAPSKTCSTDPVTVKIVNGQQNIHYVVGYTHNGINMGSVSDTVLCTKEGDTVFLTIPPGELLPGPKDSNRLYIKAISNRCDVKFNDRPQIEITEGPDTTRQLIGSTVCVGDNGTITVNKSQKGMIYQVYKGVTEVASATGNGNVLAITIPAAHLSPGKNIFSVTASIAGCATLTFRQTPSVDVVASLDVSLPISLAFDVDSTCKGLGDTVYVYNSQVGVTYTTYVNGTAIGTPVVGTGGRIAIFMPPAQLDAYSGNVTVSVKAKAGSCGEVTLTQTKKLFVNTAVDLTSEEVNISRTYDYRDYYPVCPNETYNINFPVRMYGLTASAYPVLIKPAFGDTLLGIEVYQTTSNQSVNIAFSESVLPRGSIHQLYIWTKPKGCPLHKVTNLYNTAEVLPREIRVFPEYDLNPLVTTDTVCEGALSAKFYITTFPALTLWGSEYRVYTSDGSFVSQESNRWGPRNKDGWLQLSVTDSSFLKPGDNFFTIKQAYNGCSSWTTLNPKGLVYVNPKPLNNLPLTGSSVCNGDGTITIGNSQSDVYYQAYMGASGVSDKVQGNGGDIVLYINSSYLSPGANTVSVKASIKGCSTVTLSSQAIIDRVSSTPAKPPKPSGPVEVCPGATGIVYSVPNDPMASSYTWHLPSGAVTASTVNVASVNWGTVGGFVKVTANNSCGSSPFSDSVEVAMKAAANGMISGVEKGCKGQHVILSFSGSDPVLYWQYSTDQVNWIKIPENVTTLNCGPLNETGYYRVYLGSIGSCPEVYSSIHGITVYDMPDSSFAISYKDKVCGNENVVITLFGSEPEVSYLLKDNNDIPRSISVSGTGKAIDIPVLTGTFETDGTYYFHVVARNEGGCESVIDTQAVIKASAINTSILGERSIKCLSDTFLYAVPAGGRIYRWFTNDLHNANIVGTDSSASLMVTFKEEGDYIIGVKVTDTLSGCSGEDSLRVQIVVYPPELVCPDDTTVIADYDNVTQKFSYQIKGSFLDAVAIKDCNFRELYNNLNGRTTIAGEILQSPENEVVWTVVNIRNQQTTCTTRVALRNDDEIVPPSAFSPNNDGVNDRWRIRKIELYDKAVVKVFNRWGELVYDSEKFGQYTGHEWDGYDMSGAKLPVESYHYVIDLGNGKKPIKGSVTLLR